MGARTSRRRFFCDMLAFFRVPIGPHPGTREETAIPGLHRLFGSALPLACGALFCAAARAGVTLDGSLGAAGIIAGTNYNITANLGRQVGANLFHSFGTFNIATGEVATFSATGASGAITNVISRVTGGASSINGRIASSIPGANLFLVNPGGIAFGPNASLDVSGSFHASTAHYVSLADGGRFDAAAPANSVLTTADPSAFGFLGAAAAISLQSTALAVPVGKTLSLVGGDVSLGGASLTARSGNVLLGSAASAGLAQFSSAGLDLAGVGEQGAITLTSSTLRVAEPAAAASGGGSIVIRGGRLTLAGSALDAKTVNGHGGIVDIVARADFAMSGGTLETITTGRGNAGAVALSGARITLSEGAIVDSSDDPGSTGGNGGAIRVSAAESFTILGNAGTTALVSNTFGPGTAGAIHITAPAMRMSHDATVQSGTGVVASGVTGAGNTITLDVDTLTMLSGAQIISSTQSSGAGGNINVNANAAVTIDGTRTSGGSVFPSAILANAFDRGAGGQINVNAGSLHVTGGGEISSSSQSTATAAGTGGRIAVRAAGDVAVSGMDANDKRSAIVANTFSAANAGAVEIAAATLAVDQGRVQSLTEAAGRGGEIALAVGALSVTNGGQISASAFGSGDGGAVTVRATEAILVAGTNSGIFARTEIKPGSTIVPAARGGSIAIHAPVLSLREGGGLFAITGGTGRGGEISVAADTLELMSGGRVSSQSLLFGDAGDIRIAAGSTLRLDRAAITTEARQADGGNIFIQAADLVALNRGSITATVGGGLGNGGNIAIDPLFVVLNQSEIIANAFGGNGGNITIVADNLYRSPGSTISASSRFGLTGTVVISSQTTDLSGSLAPLPADYLNIAALLAQRCAARLAGRASSFVLAGRGALPPDPGGPLPAAALAEGASASAPLATTARIQIAALGAAGLDCSK